MKTLTAQIPVTNNIPNLKKWEVVRVADNDDSSIINVNVYGAGQVQYTGQSFVLWVMLTDTHKTIANNATPTGFLDQIVYTQRAVANAYATITAAMYAVTGKAAQRLAVEAALVSTGVFGAEFA